jgi:hypothetical protein
MSKNKNTKELHKKSYSPEYRRWMAMKERCYNPKSRLYKNYGGRGIKVCDKWINSFSSFYEDLGPRPTNKYILDRINNDGNYEPGNCRWTTRRESDRNKTTTKYYEFEGKKLLLEDWSKLLNIKLSTLRNRLHKGWTTEETFQSKTRIYRHYYNYNGENLTIPQISKKTGIYEGTLRYRLIKAGLSLEESLRNIK